MCLLEEGQQTIKLLVETESRMWFPGSEREANGEMFSRETVSVL